MNTTKYKKYFKLSLGIFLILTAIPMSIHVYHYIITYTSFIAKCIANAQNIQECGGYLFCSILSGVIFCGIHCMVGVQLIKDSNFFYFI